MSSDVRRSGVARSFLFVPGTKSAWFPKAARSNAGEVILDLEDAVPSIHRAEALGSICAWLEAGHQAYVRLGAKSPRFWDDLRAITVPSLKGVVMAKADHPAAINEAARASGKPIIALIETAAGVGAATEVAQATGVARLAIGTIDLSIDLQVTDEQGLLYARSLIVLASRVAGLPGPIDGVTTRFNDTDQLMRDVARARSLGFTAKFCIHPNQVPIVNAGFEPSAEEVEWAQSVLTAVIVGNRGAFAHRDAMVDAAVVRKAQVILEGAHVDGVPRDATVRPKLRDDTE